VIDGVKPTDSRDAEEHRERTIEQEIWMPVRRLPSRLADTVGRRCRVC
jgi:hypothetical protein